MCGIVGIAATNGGELPGEAVSRAMTDAIVHRGPDDQGFFRDAKVVIGMRRLSIIDLAGGHQPVHNEDESVQCVFNGEIYNYRELRAELEGKHKFYTHSDTEVIVHGYEEWGEGVFARLDGMFGIALWDRRSQLLLLARDRYGEKPLFYANQNGLLLFASELKSLLPVPGFRREIDPEAVRSYVTFGYVPTPGSIFRGVKKVPPAHYLKLAGGTVELHRYYQVQLGPKLRISENEAEEELARLLDEAVKSRLVSDVPFGAFLSGGLDSSVVVALMARHLTQPVRTFSIGFREREFNELSDAKRVADHIKTEHHELVVEPDAVQLLHDLVWFLDEPFADASAVPTFLVAKLAREHVKMVLTGDGGDEAFAGYDRHVRFLDLERVGRLKPVVASAMHLAGRFVPRSSGYRLRRIAERLRQPFPDNYLSGVALTRADVSDELLGDAVRGGAGHYAGLSSVTAAVRSQGIDDALDQCQAIDLASYLPDDCLVKIDRMAMANSLEGRAPLLAHKVVDFAVKLPREMRVQNRRGKHILRRVAARLLPQSVLEKPKQGFGIPLGAWFRGPLRGLAADVIESGKMRDRGLVRQSAARKYLQGHLAGEADYGEILWLILCLELWARRFLDVS